MEANGGEPQCPLPPSPPALVVLNPCYLNFVIALVVASQSAEALRDVVQPGSQWRPTVENSKFGFGTTTVGTDLVIKVMVIVCKLLCLFLCSVVQLYCYR